MRLRLCVVLVCWCALGWRAPAQEVFTDTFPPEEFAARRTRVMAAIGDGVALVHGAPERSAEIAFRQNNHFFYLTGVEVPRAVVTIDGRTKQTRLYLPPKSERRDRMFGPSLVPGDEAARTTGVDAVVDREQLAAALLAIARDGRTLYTPFRPEVMGGGSVGEAVGHAAATANDPWDGRPSREAAFIAKVKALAPAIELRNLDPILDAARFIKSPREIALVREATRITGLGIMEAIREAAPGKREYELSAAAEYVFRKFGSQGPAYFPLSASGPTTVYSHYHAGTRRLADGDLVQFDYAPDYRYYVSDVTRVFPANGRFTPFQREIYSIYLRLYRAVMLSIRPRVPVRDLLREAVTKMDAALASFTFTDAKIERAARAFVERYRGRLGVASSFGHDVGMEVHDVTVRAETLEPGRLFTIEPAISVPDDQLAFRLEDVILVTETGYENLSAFVPTEIDDIERLMREPGLSEGRSWSGQIGSGVARRPSPGGR
jgi:Xaa-Pro aminopeptidase